MGEFSPIHWLIVLAIMLFFFGGRKIPEVSEGARRGHSQFQRGNVRRERTTPPPPQQANSSCGKARGRKEGRHFADRIDSLRSGSPGAASFLRTPFPFVERG